MVGLGRKAVKQSVRARRACGREGRDPGGRVGGTIDATSTVVHQSSSPALGWRAVAATPWITPGASGGRGLRPLAAVLRGAHRLPTWAPAVSTRHTLSPRLPHGGQLAALLTALHGRVVVVNQPPSALVPADTAALVRGLVGTVLFGLPASPWLAGSPTWPRPP